MLIAGDIGGTHTRLALAASGEGAPHILFSRHYASREYADMETVLAAFLADAQSQGCATAELHAACFGVAGAVVDNCAQITYLPWRVDGDAIAARFAIDRVHIVNDFWAAASGIPTLDASELFTLQDAPPQPAIAPLITLPVTRLVIGAGTGLGVAIVQGEGQGRSVIAGEGGHFSFAPVDEAQIELWRTLRKELPRVTVESVVSGPGLVRIYRHLRQGSPAPRPDPLAAPDPAAAISAAALQRGEPVARRSLDMFIACFGAFAGDLALTASAYGGVYLCGGIAPKLLPYLAQDGFLNAFNAKGIHKRLTRLMPVRVVTQPQLGLHGALLLASEQAMAGS